ncbi:unnamed protein product [Gongylonema pulchrum]|uniref:Profilin n=1 Tax=Gongylonema pulchrum TaxID=637853 RepID=A0A183D8U0_9BILA|nr:unnamed protein product [Gongylonema pulchrum]
MVQRQHRKTIACFYVDAGKLLVSGQDEACCAFTLVDGVLIKHGYVPNFMFITRVTLKMAVCAAVIAHSKHLLSRNCENTWNYMGKNLQYQLLL